MSTVKLYCGALPNMPWQEKPASCSTPVWRYTENPVIGRNPLPGVERIFSISHTDAHFADLAKCIAPFGRLCAIDECGPIDVRLLKPRSASLHWEGMFTRSGFNLPDMGEQGALLSRVADLVDAGRVRSTLAQQGGRITAANLVAAHAAVESGRMVGKIVLEGF